MSRPDLHPLLLSNIVAVTFAFPPKEIFLMASSISGNTEENPTVH
jgi:hypothetical protein